MGKKLFISYSHKDETHREDFEDHLSVLKRRGVVDVWHDRRIVPGSEWKGEIDRNLEEADIVVLLISPSFLASDYCFDVELKRAMERKDDGVAEIIAILVRPCDWSDCEFSKYQAVPKDAKPITTWSDPDSAWLDVVNGLKSHIENFEPKFIEEDVPSIAGSVGVSVSFKTWLDDTEIALTHRKVDTVSLADIFVMPDIELDESSDSEIVSIKSIDSVIKNSGFYLLSGEEQQGKTSILKRLCSRFYDDGFVPVYLNAIDIKKSDLIEVISKSLSWQYESFSYCDLIDSGKSIILIDNIDEIGLNSKYAGRLIEELNSLFGFVIMTCHSSFSYVQGEIRGLHDYVHGEVLSLGNKKREELVRKWVALGQEESIDDFSLYSECDELKARLDTVIKKNIVPPRPIYILMLLQMFEANSQLNLDLTSYGHCYQQLIYQAFDKAGIKKVEFDKYINILTEFSWEVFQKDGGLDEARVEYFVDSYSKRFLSVDFVDAFSRLRSNSILTDRDQFLSFKYPYLYYFFVGKKIAESYSEVSEVKRSVEALLRNLHREDYANILIFISHHTKDSWVLDEIKSTLRELFDAHVPTSLERGQLAFMNDFMRKIPELVIEQREIQKERDDHNENLDRLERSEEVQQGEPHDLLGNINKAFKGIEIAGQIIRNRHATLTRSSLFELADCGVSTGLRFLKYFIEISDSAKNEIIKMIAVHLSESPGISDREIEKQAENAYLHLTYGVINSVVRKVAGSIGSKEALEIYFLLEKEKQTPAFTLIRQSIELQFNKSLDIKSLSKSLSYLHDNPVGVRILKEMVVQHIYMFPVDYKEKQKLSSKLGISIQGQRFLDQHKLGKG
ncbi:toll/interleukin-1 receptor domain-containing protein [Marinobacter sediminicola]|uniref:toll/interleukin-1 receptor domain-containing protein n=1 Tax=Marinobacter sediminicola TaxID=3072994 RepID=UPI0028126BBD|nr:toll/interleukin-1 receptor domain-containing protein [Marinobacter sp. F26243]